MYVINYSITIVSSNLQLYMYNYIISYTNVYFTVLSITTIKQIVMCNMTSNHKMILHYKKGFRTIYLKVHSATTLRRTSRILKDIIVNSLGAKERTAPSEISVLI